MSEKKRMTTWVPTIVMGVVAILFSVYALQQQTEVQRAREEMEHLKSDLNSCQQQVTEEEAKVEEALRRAQIALAEAETQYRRALKLESSSKRKK
ncbi:MAG TPA: hypothetical protein VG737_07400 [Cyclobacteriaceae bacterium]|nr:hypothetical protein [Cyclobacteriaceae bacterium]